MSPLLSLKQQSSFRWFETPCPSRNVTVTWYIYAIPSYLYCCKQLWINWFIYVHLYSKLCKMQLAVMFWQHSNPISGVSPHKRPLNLCLFVDSLSKLLKQQSIRWCWKTSCGISYIFSLKFKVHPQILQFPREINYDNNLINFSLRSYVLSSSLLGRSSRT